MQLCSCYQPFIITSRAETSHKKASFCLKFRSSSSYVNCSISVRHMPYRCPPYAVHMSGLCRTRVWLMPDTYDVKHIKTGTDTTYSPVRVKNQRLCQLPHSGWPENGFLSRTSIFNEFAHIVMTRSKKTVQVIENDA